MVERDGGAGGSGDGRDVGCGRRSRCGGAGGWRESGDEDVDCGGRAVGEDEPPELDHGDEVAYQRRGVQDDGFLLHGFCRWPRHSSGLFGLKWGAIERVDWLLGMRCSP